MQRMLFSDLIPSWKESDDIEQMHRIGCNARWALTADTMAKVPSNNSGLGRLLRLSAFEAEEAYRKSRRPSILKD